ncbi:MULTISPECIES: cobalt-precorrin 5A hydrolase [unclassified Treponema]|uniref:cobalt-precorrin 5A hydrolase n=1 Tax=unclassified Treponema TaxID=2638727 RepID=UPI0020A2CFE1|nr:MULTISPECIES: cobalt-precorrin 5A hydrolase [unclassified Treponema]UTC66523.1 cobalt-precorrin 5A hydrolase [Treponema sp. OMZ 789]UTC69255.1 cobalt-precorrin 5A hydrolase [Treponema sp. OMZ 790]UTC71968.1 cobalt-precorrin 5A hydrolase [Treponema sp. OMZ 791]
MKKIAVYSFTEKGKLLGEKLSRLNSEIEHFYNAKTAGGIWSLIPDDFKNRDALIFISSTGIAVRMIRDYIQDKSQDPAVLVIDDMGRFVISLLSGHLGGANALTEKIASTIGAVSVITTASDGRNIEAVDLFAQKNNYAILSMEDAKIITALMVDGKNIGFYSEDKAPPINYPNLFILQEEDFNSNLKALKEEKSLEGLIIVSNKKRETVSALSDSLPMVHLVPKNLNLGIGLKKGVNKETLAETVRRTLDSINKDLRAVKAIASIELKQNEKGLLDFAKELNISPVFFSESQIEKIEDNFEKSDFVKKTVGVYNVSAPSAFLLGGKIILDKFKHEGVTVSVAEE